MEDSAGSQVNPSVKGKINSSRHFLARFFFEMSFCLFVSGDHLVFSRGKSGTPKKNLPKFLLAGAPPLKKLEGWLFAWPLFADLRTPVLSPLAGCCLRQRTDLAFPLQTVSTL